MSTSVVPAGRLSARSLSLSLLVIAVSGGTVGFSALQVKRAFDAAAESAPLPAVTLSVRADGRTLPVTLRSGRSVRSALHATGVRVGPTDVVTPSMASPVSPGLTIKVRRATPLTVMADGESRQITTAATTPRKVLHQLAINLTPHDRLYPSADGSLWPGATIRVVRIHREEGIRRVVIPATTVRKRDGTLPRGMVKVTAGRSGLKVQRLVHTFADGRQVATSYLGQEIVRPARPRVVRVGTRVLIASRGEFAGHELLIMEATAYAPWHGKGVDGTTAIGLNAGYGVVAVDPGVIPLRSRLYIDGYGHAIAGDTGGAIKGTRIDLGFDSVREAIKFGRRPVRVYIVSRGASKRK